jgi:hypothetical protein
MTKLRRTAVASIPAAGALTVGGVGTSNALAANSHPGTSQHRSSGSGSNSGSSSTTHHCPNDDSGSSSNSGSSSTTSISV